MAWRCSILKMTFLAGLITCTIIFLTPFAQAADCSNPDGDLGEIIFNQDHEVFQGCRKVGWQAFHTFSEPDPCAGSPAIGTICADSSIYAGLTPDGNVKMFMASANEGDFAWATDTGTRRFVNDTATGEANTNTLGTFGAGAHPAAEACLNTVAHGQSDWYLPALDELALVYAVVGSTGGSYWTSTESTAGGFPFQALYQSFIVGVTSQNPVNSVFSVRCVRKE